MAGGGLLYVYVYPPILLTVSYMLGRPYFENCTTAIKSEGPIKAGKFRITEHLCSPSERTMYVVFLLPSAEFGAVPLFHSLVSPIPQDVRQHDSQRYEIVLATPLSDGRDRLPVTLDATGLPERYYGFRNGRAED